MTALDAFGGWGPAFAIGGMALATYLCRIAGVLLMSRVRVTPAVERALAALPGSIVVSTMVPIGIRSGWDGLAGIVVGMVVMRVTRNEVAALAGGLACAALARAFVT